MEPTFRKLGKLVDTRTERRFGQAPAYLQNTQRRPKGHVEISDPTFGTQGGDTAMCVHCQFHWVIQPGSGIARGFCLRCNGPTCGKKACETRCVPFEKMIEKLERMGRLDAAIAKTRAL